MTRLSPCSVSSTNTWVMNLDLGVWGAKEVQGGSPVMRIEYYTPFMFYRYPDSVGTGGLVWQGSRSSDDLRSGPASDACPQVWLELYHAVENGQVVSRGFWAGYGGANGLQPGDWQKYSFLKGDAIADLVQLAFWGGSRVACPVSGPVP